MLGLGGGLTGGAVLDSVVTPDSVSDLAFWFKNNTNVVPERWSDSSGNSNHMNQVDEELQASVDSGGLLFVGNESHHYDLSSAINIGASNPFTMIIVAYLASYTTQNCILGDNNASDIFLEFQQEDQMRFRQSSTSAVLKFPSSTPFPVRQKFMITMTKDSSRNLVVYKNGSVLTQESSTGNPVASGVFGCDQVGGRSSAPDRDFDGIIYELLLYQKIVGSEELAGLHAEIQSRNGL